MSAFLAAAAAIAVLVSAADARTPSPLPPRFSHVVVIVFENKEAGQIAGNPDAPTFNNVKIAPKTTPWSEPRIAIGPDGTRWGITYDSVSSLAKVSVERLSIMILPWLAVSLYRAFLRARDMAQRHMYDTDALTVSLPWVIDEIERGREIPWDYSIAGSRPTLEALLQYLDEQRLTRRRVDVAELFAPNVSPALAQYLSATGEAD